MESKQWQNKRNLDKSKQFRNALFNISGFLQRVIRVVKLTNSIPATTSCTSASGNTPIHLTTPYSGPSSLSHTMRSVTCSKALTSFLASVLLLRTFSEYEDRSGKKMQKMSIFLETKCSFLWPEFSTLLLTYFTLMPHFQWVQNTLRVQNIVFFKAKKSAT